MKYNKNNILHKVTRFFAITVMVGAGVVLSGCMNVDGTMVQHKYVAKRDECRDYSETYMNIHQKHFMAQRPQGFSKRDVNSLLATIFSECMYEKGWAVTAPDKQKMRGMPPVAMPGSSGAPVAPPAAQRMPAPAPVAAARQPRPMQQTVPQQLTPRQAAPAKAPVEPIKLPKNQPYRAKYTNDNSLVNNGGRATLPKNSGYMGADSASSKGIY